MNEINTPVHQLPAGTALNNKYEIIRTLGEGGFGITYLGHNKVLDIPVAIKEYFPQGYAIRTVTQNLTVTITDKTKNSYFSEWKMKFLAEARMLAKFAHLPGIVNVYDFFEQNGTAYIIMEYLDGITLKKYVEENGPMDTSTFFKRLIPVLTSLEKIHKDGHIHRDISPDNLMLMDDGFLKLYDFGAAREYSDATQSNFSVIIKPGFAPEEQYRSKGDQRAWTDVYSICATIYFAISGVVPDDSLQRAHKDELKKPSELGVNISPKIEKVLLKGMSVKSADRFDTVRPLIDAFEEADIKPPKRPIFGKEKKPKEKKPQIIFPFFHSSSKQVESTSTPQPASVSDVDKTEIIPNTEYDPSCNVSYDSVDNEVKRRPKPDLANDQLPSHVENSNVQTASGNSLSASADNSEQAAQNTKKEPADSDGQKNSDNSASDISVLSDAQRKAENKTKILCPKCDTVLPSTAKFCGKCGIKLLSFKNSTNNNDQTAASSNISESAANKSIQKASANSAEQKNSDDSAATTASDSGTANNQADKNASENKTEKVCPKCKAILPQSAKFCGKCGIPLLSFTANSGT